MASDPVGMGRATRPPTRLPLGVSRRRLSFERRLRFSLFGMGLPAVLLCWLLFYRARFDVSVQLLALFLSALAWIFLVSLVTEQITRPLQTLANVIAALREDDFSFRARGGRRNDAMGDLAIEVNALARLLQARRTGALEAMALLERVMDSMQSPVVAFSPEGHLRLLNAAAEKTFQLQSSNAIGRSAEELNLGSLLASSDNDLISLDDTSHSDRWVVKRSRFRLRGIPHTLLVLSDVSSALRDEERLAWERLIRVLGHEINNSLTPIKSIAGSLRLRLSTAQAAVLDDDFAGGLAVIEDRAESLNRFLQAYRELMGLPAPQIVAISIDHILQRVAQLETRVPVRVEGTGDPGLHADPDQMQQALINLVRNAAEASLGVESAAHTPRIEIEWRRGVAEMQIVIRDNGLGLSNESNIFVPFYTTKPGGTGVGLVLAKQIAESHRGTLQLVNRPDGRPGCEAQLRLPLTVSSLL